MGRVKLACILVFVLVPSLVGAEDYIRPSVMPTGQDLAVTKLFDYSNYSYEDEPFDKISSRISVGYFLSAENAVYQITVNITNQRDRYVSLNTVPYFCKIGSDDCRRLSCNYHSTGMDMQPHSSKNIFCSIIVSECAGREIRLEYSMPGVKGGIIAKNIARCPQKFCDQVAGSVSVPKLSYVGDKILAEGYFSVIGGSGMASPVTVRAGKYNVNTSSNDFGYWRAPIEIDEPGFYEISAISGSCSREAKASVQIFGIGDKPSNYTLYVYPKNLDVKIGGSALVAVQNNGAKEIEVSLSGVPSDWVEPAKFLMKQGIKFVYVSPKNAGSYLIGIRSGSEERTVDLFVVDKNHVRQDKENDPPVLVVLLAVAFFLLLFKRTGSGDHKKVRYLDEVKKEIENSAGLF